MRPRPFTSALMMLTFISLFVLLGAMAVISAAGSWMVDVIDRRRLARAASK